MSDHDPPSDDSGIDLDRAPVAVTDVSVGTVEGFVERSEPISHVDADADILVDEAGSERRVFHLPWRSDGDARIVADTEDVVPLKEHR